MNKEFIPHEQALELKELGFDDECVGYYSPDMDGKYYLFTSSTDNTYRMEKYNPNVCPAPLYQQAFRWFREKYSLVGTPQYFTAGYYCYTINDMKDTNESNRLFTEFTTYEEAELACLKKLIEIVKNK